MGPSVWTVNHPPGFKHEWGALSSTGAGIWEGAGGSAVRPLAVESAVVPAQVGQCTLQGPSPLLSRNLLWHITPGRDRCGAERLDPREILKDV